MLHLFPRGQLEVIEFLHSTDTLSELEQRVSVGNVRELEGLKKLTLHLKLYPFWNLTWKMCLVTTRTKTTGDARG